MNLKHQLQIVTHRGWASTTNYIDIPENQEIRWHYYQWASLQLVITLRVPRHKDDMQSGLLQRYPYTCTGLRAPVKIDKDVCIINRKIQAAKPRRTFSIRYNYIQAIRHNYIQPSKWEVRITNYNPLLVTISYININVDTNPNNITFHRVQELHLPPWATFDNQAWQRNIKRVKQEGCR